MVQGRNDYLPFGESWSTGGQSSAGGSAASARYKFNGKELQTTGGVDLLDYGARMYDSKIGRWLTQDPLAEKYYSMSSYNYCANNPIKFIDPDGKDYTVYIDRDENGKVTGLRVSATIYTTGNNASDERTKELNKLAKGMFKTKSVEGISVSFDINYVHNPSISADDLKPGENILDFNDKTSTKSDRSNVTTWYEGASGNRGEIYSDADNYTVMHETGHLLGLSDRHTDLYIPNWGSGTEIHPGYGNDLMSGGGKGKVLQGSHYEHYTQAFGGIKYVNSVLARTMIDYNQKTQTLKTPHEKGGRHAWNENRKRK